MVSTVLRFLILVTRKVQKYLIDTDRRLGAGFDASRHTSRLRQSAQAHDMVSHPDEAYYAAQYWQCMQRVLEDSAAHVRHGRILDLGCGQGRMTMRMAEWCGADARITAVDLSNDAIARARTYAQQQGLAAITFQQADIKEYIRTVEPGSLDCIILLEVVYCLPDYRDVLAVCVRALRPGGVLFLSTRSQYFYALDLLSEGTYGAVGDLLEHRSGRLLGDDIWYNWSTAAELKGMIRDELGLDVLFLSAIGACSGIDGDPKAYLAQPSRLHPDLMPVLMTLERGIGESCPDAGRYMLVAAKKP